MACRLGPDKLQQTAVGFIVPTEVISVEHKGRSPRVPAARAPHGREAVTWLRRKSQLPERARAGARGGSLAGQFVRAGLPLCVGPSLRNST